jgi:uncharacterized protein YjbI with pentapeptide repeats
MGVNDVSTLDLTDGAKEYWSKNFYGLQLSGLELSSTEFEACTFKNCDFSEAVFKRCNFIDCEFVGCNLSVVNLEYSKFSEVVFRDSKAIGVNWTLATWPNMAFSSPIQFYKCIINDSSFIGLTLQDIVIEECKAHCVDFRDGDFRSANFTYSDLRASLFGNTNLGGADFSEATDYDIDIHENDLKGARFSRFEAVRLLEFLEIELVD